MANKQLTDQQLEWAKAEYMNYRSISDIARALSVPRTTIQYHVNEKWKTERTLRRNELAAELSESKVALISSTFSASYKGVHNWVKTVTDPSYTLKPHEVKTLMAIIESMDKITRLDAGSPTDIVSEITPVSVLEIRKKIMENDPFAIEDADYTEITSETSHDNENPEAPDQ